MVCIWTPLRRKLIWFAAAHKMQMHFPPLPDTLQNIQLLLDHHIERLKRARVRNIPVYRSRNYIETAR